MWRAQGILQINNPTIGHIRNTGLKSFAYILIPNLMKQVSFIEDERRICKKVREKRYVFLLRCHMEKKL